MSESKVAEAREALNAAIRAYAKEHRNTAFTTAAERELLVDALIEAQNSYEAAVREDERARAADERVMATALIGALEDALAHIVQRIDENPNEECPFCEPRVSDAGADHERECPITTAHAALVLAAKGGAK